MGRKDISFVSFYLEIMNFYVLCMGYLELVDVSFKSSYIQKWERNIRKNALLMSTQDLMTKKIFRFMVPGNYPLIANSGVVTYKVHLEQGVAWLMSRHL